MSQRNERKIQYLLQGNQCDSWTQNFCNSLFLQIQEGRELSDRQVEILNQKYVEFGPEAVAAESDWLSRWTDLEAEAFSVCARYYKGTGYFRALAAKVDDEGNILDGFIPRKREYQKMCNNKYALKVLAAWYAQPKYPIGAIVAIRATAPTRAAGKPLPKHKDGKTIAYFIVETNSSPPVAACAGGKQYKVIAAGSSEIIEIEERHLKKMKKR